MCNNRAATRCPRGRRVESRRDPCPAHRRRPPRVGAAQCLLSPLHHRGGLRIRRWRGPAAPGRHEPGAPVTVSDSYRRRICRESRLTRFFPESLSCAHSRATPSGAKTGRSTRYRNATKANVTTSPRIILECRSGEHTAEAGCRRLRSRSTCFVLVQVAQAFSRYPDWRRSGRGEEP
jgi:hypothetical protein